MDFVGIFLLSSLMIIFHDDQVISIFAFGSTNNIIAKSEEKICILVKIKISCSNYLQN